ncbi:MAG: hypothetical protein ACMXYG_00860 [Candidatus Woesearchaeota archaeon]
MTIVGFNFIKISAEKLAPVTGKVNINNNIMLSDVKEIDVNLGSKDNKGLRVEFNYICDYEPKIGKISLNGEVLIVEDQAKINDSLAQWKKNKTLDKELTHQVMTHILNKSTIQALIMSKDILLPAPIPLPKIQTNKKE